MADIVEVELGEVGRPDPVADARRPRWRLRLLVAAAVVTVVAGVVVFDTPDPSVLARLPVRGSLAGQAAVLDALRERAADVQHPDAGRTWRAAWRPQADVVLAADVAAARVALVEVTQRSGLSQRRAQVWLAGPAGADAADLTEVAVRPAAGVSVLILPRAGADGGTLALVVGTERTEVQVEGGAWLNSDATVDWLPSPVDDDRHVWAVDVDDAGGARLLTVDGSRQVVQPSGDWSGIGDADVLALVGDGPRRCCVSAPSATPGTPGRSRVLASLAAGQRASGSGAASTLRFLQWSGELAGMPADVVSVAAPSGAQVLSVIEAGGTRTWSTTMRALQPESLAFPFTPPNTRDDWVGLVGPRGATQAEVVTVDGERIAVPLADGVGAVRARLPVDGFVTFSDARGRMLSQGLPVLTGGGPVAAVSR